jgi:hypothetical protein
MVGVCTFEKRIRMRKQPQKLHVGGQRVEQLSDHHPPAPLIFERVLCRAFSRPLFGGPALGPIRVESGMKNLSAFHPLHYWLSITSSSQSDTR